MRTTYSIRLWASVDAPSLGVRRPDVDRRNPGFVWVRESLAWAQRWPDRASAERARAVWADWGLDAQIVEHS